MSGRIKLGLTRNRLFEFNNTVVFCGKYKSFIDENEANKALKMLAFSSGCKTVHSRLALPLAVFKEFFRRETRRKNRIFIHK